MVARPTLNTRLHYQFRVERDGGREPVANLLVNPPTRHSAKPIYQLAPVTPTVSVCGLWIDWSKRLTKLGFVCLFCCSPLAQSGLLTHCLAYLIADLVNSLSVTVTCLEPVLHQRMHRARFTVVLLSFGAIRASLGVRTLGPAWCCVSAADKRVFVTTTVANPLSIEPLCHDNSFTTAISKVRHLRPARRVKETDARPQ